MNVQTMPFQENFLPANKIYQPKCRQIAPWLAILRAVYRIQPDFYLETLHFAAEHFDNDGISVHHANNPGVNKA